MAARHAGEAPAQRVRERLRDPEGGEPRHPHRRDGLQPQQLRPAKSYHGGVKTMRVEKAGGNACDSPEQQEYLKFSLAR
eukprot:250674-Rhodomonas_salina.5